MEKTEKGWLAGEIASFSKLIFLFPQDPEFRMKLRSLFFRSLRLHMIRFKNVEKIAEAKQQILITTPTFFARNKWKSSKTTKEQIKKRS